MVQSKRYDEIPHLSISTTETSTPDDFLEESFVNLSLLESDTQCLAVDQAEHEDFDDERLENVCAILDACAVPHLHHCERDNEEDDMDKSSDSFDVSLSSIESESESDIAAELDMYPLEGDAAGSQRQQSTLQDNMSSDPPLDPAKSFGFHRFLPPPHIMRNSPPWLGKDDDINKIKQICGDIERMTDSANDYSIWGFDQKIAGCHIKLEKTDSNFKRQVREVPVLHLTKQKIVNVCSAYKKSGFKEIIRFMMDNDKIEDITKLISADNIRSATRLIRRVGLSLNFALQVEFVQQLTDEDCAAILQDIEDLPPNILASKWEQKFQDHVNVKSQSDATYTMHVDMMNHCFEAVAIAFAERIGGAAGYHLLRATMKSSLLFAYTNGASQYAAFTTRLLSDHCSAPPVIQGLKKDFFSVPYGTSCVNYGLDTIREEDHKKCKKFYRPGANAAVLSSRMNRLNEASEVIEQRIKSISNTSDSAKSLEDHSNWSITDNDVKYILKAAAMIFRQGALTQNNAKVPYNVYARKGHIVLSEAVLDKEAHKCGEYLLHKYLQQEGLFCVSTADLEELKPNVTEPKQLVEKVLKGNSQLANSKLKLLPSRNQKTC